MADVDPNPPPDFQKLADAFAVSLGEIGKWTILKWDPLKLVTDAIALFLSIPIRLLGEVAVFAAATLVKTFERANPEVNALASIALSEIFGTEITVRATGRGGSGDAAETAGRQVFQSLFGELAETGAEVGPAIAPAEKFLGALLGVPIRGWLLELIPDLLPEAVHIQPFHELISGVIQGGGFGRLTRAALMPAIKAAIATPLELHFNEQLRPALLSSGTLAKAWARGHWDDATARRELAWQGFSDARIDEILNDSLPRIGAGEVALLYHARRWDAETALGYLVDSGYQRADAQELIALPALRELQALEKDLVQAATKAFLDFTIDGAAFLDAVGDLIPDVDHGQYRLETLTKIRGWLRKDLTLAQLDAALDKNVIDLLEWRDKLRQANYTDDDITILELTRRELAASRADQAAHRAELKAATTAAREAAARQKAADAAARRTAADEKAAAIRQQRDQMAKEKAAAAEAKREQLAAAHLALTKAREDAQRAKLLTDAEIAQLTAGQQATAAQQAIVERALEHATIELDRQTAAAERAQREARQAADAADRAIADANIKADAEESLIRERRLERIAAFEARLALVDEQEASGLLTADAAQKQRDHLNELEREAEAAEKLDELAITQARQAAAALKGNALARVAAAAEQVALLPTVAERARQRIAAEAALKQKLSSDVSAAKLASDAKIASKRIAAFDAARAAYDRLLEELEEQRRALEARIAAGSPPPPTT